MDIEETLYQELKSILANIYPLNAPEGTLAPYIIYTSSEGIYNKDLNGFLDTKEVIVKIDIIHNTYSEMKSMSKLVMNKIKSFEGRLVQEVIFDNEGIELYENEINKYRKIISFKVNFKEE